MMHPQSSRPSCFDAANSLHLVKRLVGPALAIGLAIGLATNLPEAAAHESPLPSATLVQRDGGHLTLTLRLDLARSLHRTLQPEAAPTEALALMAAMEPARFAALWEQATRRWAQDTALLVQGRSQTAARWTWPLARDAQANLQQQLMPQLTGGHAEHELLSAQAEFRVGGEGLGKVQLKLPPALRPLTVTTLRPRQQRVGEGDNPIALSF